MQVPITFDQLWFQRSLLQAVGGTAVGSPIRARTALTASPGWNARIKTALGRMYGKGPLARRVFRSLISIKRLMNVVAPVEHAGEILEQILSVEWLVHVEHDQPWHRDHALHPARVTMLGNWILDCSAVRAQAATTLQNEWQARAQVLGVGNLGDPLTWERILRLAWTCAGLFHDHAYPAELSRRIADGVDRRFGLGRRETVKRTVQRYLAKVLANVPGNHFHQLVRHDDLDARCENPHAPMGGVALLHDPRFGQGRHGMWDLVLEIAALAVYRHHADDPVSFDQHPVTFLLVLCDGLQEWDRVSFFYWSDVCSSPAPPPPRTSHLQKAWKGGVALIDTAVPCTHVEADLSPGGQLEFRCPLAPSVTLGRVGFDRTIMEADLLALRDRLRPAPPFPPIARVRVLP